MEDKGACFSLSCRDNHPSVCDALIISSCLASPEVFPVKAWWGCPQSARNLRPQSLTVFHRSALRKNRLKTSAGPSLVAQTVNNPFLIQETQVQSLGGEDPLEEGMATHSFFLIDC